MDAAETATNEAGLALDVTGKAVEQTQDAARLAASERKKLSAHLNGKAKSLLPAALTDDDGNTNYLIASFPELRCVNYVRLPDLVWRPLIVSGILSPHSVVIDEDRSRLYIADSALAKIVWYQLITLPDKTLISDGRQHVAVQAHAVRGMALDLSGNLWFSGKSLPAPPIPSTDAIFKQSLMIIDQSALSGTPVDPIPTWTNLNTKSSVAPLALDAFNIFYGNDLDGTKKGSVVKAGQSVPASDPASGLSPMSDNIDKTYSVAVTPTALFYGADDAIYGVLKTKSGASCGASGDLCKVVTDLVKKPTSMLWDGDGTVYVADNGNGAIYSFASGSVSPHELDKIIDAGEVWGLDVYKVTAKQDSSARSTASLTVLIVLVSTMLFNFYV